MKNRVFVFVMLATAMAGLVSCNCKPARYAVTLEPLAGTEVQPWQDGKVTAALWDDNMAPATATMVNGKEGMTLVRQDTAERKGMVRVVYPLEAANDMGCVTLNSVQKALPLGAGMVYYGETTDGAPDAVALKAVCGVLRLHLTTAERLATVSLGTDDSNRYMSGVFGVDNYPFPVLTPTDGSVRSVTLAGLDEVDFEQGAEVYCYLAPGRYSTFTVVMTTTDGRVCTKHLKEGREVLVDRNGVSTVTLGGEDLPPLVFE